MQLDFINRGPTEFGVPPTPIGLPTLTKWAFDGVDLAPVWNMLVHRVTKEPDDAAAFIDLSTIAHLQGRPSDRIILQAQALDLQRIYRQPAASSKHAIKLLAFMAPGDFMANIPIEFLLAGSEVALDMIYVIPGMPLPKPIPEHDIALVAVAESDENQTVLKEIGNFVKAWSRPVINAPDRIARLTRGGTWELLRSAPGVVMPMNVRIDRTALAGVGLGDLLVDDLLGGSRFPIIARPAASHAGEGLIKLENRMAIEPYLSERAELDFCIAPFIDYRNADGLYRKYRVALIEGRPYACHMAISNHWMIHYLNAGMRDSPAKRSEEARFMAEFDQDFAVRHAAAFSAVAKLVELEYLPIDCGETQDGRLLIFESGTNMIVHSMDPPDVFPYKKAQMEKVFLAFRTMLRNISSRAVDVSYMTATEAKDTEHASACA